MSFKLGGIVIEDLNRGLTAHEKLILVCYASFGLADGTSIHPSQATIAKMAMCKPRMVRKALVKFEAARVMIFVQMVGRRKEYRLDIERAIELYEDEKKAAYSAGMDAEKAAYSAGMDAEKAAYSAGMDAEKAAYSAGMDAEKAAYSAGMDAEKAAYSAGGPAAHDDRIAAHDDQNSGTVCQESYKNPVKNPSAPVGAGGKKAAPPPADPGAHWRDCEAALRERFGEADYEAWISTLAAVSDFGGLLKLAAPSRFIEEVVCKEYRAGIAEVTGREVEIEHRNFPEKPKDAAA